jgi:hypothetical protein
LGPAVLVGWVVGVMGCNPFLEPDGGVGSSCVDDHDCASRLVCLEGVCVEWLDGGRPDGGLFDADGDGYDALASGGTDCDDGDPGVHPNADEACNGRDDDCDGQTDEGLDVRACERANAHGRCTGSESCAGPDGWLGCDAPTPAAEDCNGTDDDCDGATDEQLADQPCPLQAGVCAGALRSCVEQAWTACDYGPDYDAGPETTCDRLDNDCDGATDEDGELRLEAELGAQAGDGLDNNCNGLIDEPGGVMVPLPNYPGVWIDAYEMAVFDRPDCTGSRYGAAADDYPAGWPVDGNPPAVELYACSLPGVIPSGHLSWYRARNACQAQGKRLCGRREFSGACHESSEWPYGPLYTPGICNDALSGAGQVAASGEYAGCASEVQAHDMVGNLSEWVQEWVAGDPECADCARIGDWGYACEYYRRGLEPVSCSRPPDDEDRDEIQRLSDCPVEDSTRNAFPRSTALVHFGARCCYDRP